MSLRQWLALTGILLVYLFLGTGIFYYIERPKETENRASALLERIKINEMLVKYLTPENDTTQNNILGEISDYCGKPVTNYTLDEYPDDYQWTFYHTFWFSLTTCSTVGYGNLSPREPIGQIVVIIYSIIGMPLHGFFLAYLGDYFARAFYSIHKRYKEYKYATTKNYVPPKIGLIGRIIILLIPGIAFFIFLSAFIISYFENWSYITAVYYAYITLTTIGYGDYVATYQNGQEREFGIYFVFYEIFIIIWNVLGNGYFLMIIGFVARGMQGKTITRLEHQLSQNIKATQQRIWAGVTKDVSFLRRILNEAHMMKFKPVYTDLTENTTFNSLPRSSSCPELTLYRVITPHVVRRRAYSQNYGHQLDSPTISIVTLNRVQSEGDLSRIDKKKTFEGAEHLFKTGNILTQVVTALGNIRPMDEDGQSCLELGVQGFSDSQILSGEKIGSRWSLAQSDGSYTNPPSRRRAASDFRGPLHDSSNEWTWNGNNTDDIRDFMRNKAKKHSIAAIYQTKEDQSNRSVALNISDNLQVPIEARNRSFISKINPFRIFQDDDKRHSVTSQDINPQIYLENTSRGRESRISLPRQYLSASARGRASVFSMLEQPLNGKNTELLENTTIADLIRALEIVHTKANTASEIPLIGNGYTETPKRKVGTATPPSHANVNLQLPINNSRRGSLRPIPGYTTIFASQNSRKKSYVDPELAATIRRSSLRPTHPPPYSVTPIPMTRKFSVRPTNLSIPPGQAPPLNTSIQVSSVLQRKLSLRPSPLARNTGSNASGPQFTGNNSQPPMITVNRVQPTNVTTRNLLQRPAQLQASATTQDNSSELNDKKS